MNNAVNFGVIFTPKFSKTKNGTAPLYARITVNGERIELSLKRRITLSLWNEKRSLLTGYSEESQQVNKTLDCIFNKIYESFRQFKEENKLLALKALKLVLTAVRWKNGFGLSLKFSKYSGMMLC